MLVIAGVVFYIFTTWIAYEIGNHNGFNQGVMDTLREFRLSQSTPRNEESHE